MYPSNGPHDPKRFGRVEKLQDIFGWSLENATAQYLSPCYSSNFFCVQKLELQQLLLFFSPPSLLLAHPFSFYSFRGTIFKCYRTQEICFLGLFLIIWLHFLASFPAKYTDKKEKKNSNSTEMKLRIVVLLGSSLRFTMLRVNLHCPFS